jgi:hypothetical protein
VAFRGNLVPVFSGARQRHTKGRMNTFHIVILSTTFELLPLCIQNEIASIKKKVLEKTFGCKHNEFSGECRVLCNQKLYDMYR